MLAVQSRSWSEQAWMTAGRTLRTSTKRDHETGSAGADCLPRALATTRPWGGTQQLAVG